MGKLNITDELMSLIGENPGLNGHEIHVKMKTKCTRALVINEINSLIQQGLVSKKGSSCQNLRYYLNLEIAKRKTIRIGNSEITTTVNRFCSPDCF